MIKAQGILSQTPGHDTPGLLLVDNILELAGDDLWSVPRPEEPSLVVKVVLTTGFLVSLAVLLSTTPGVNRRYALAGTIVRETATLAMGIGFSTKKENKKD